MADHWRGAIESLRRMVTLAERNIRVAEFHGAIALRDGARRKVYEGDPSWPPLSPITIAAHPKNSTKAFASREFANAIQAKRLPGSGCAAGVFPGANSNGIDMSVIARVHEFGMTIKPKSGRMLAIPANREAMLAQRKYGSVRSIPDLVHPKGTRILGKEVRGSKKAGRRFVIWFILVPSVRIPARSFLWSTRREIAPQLVSLAMEAYNMALRGQALRGPSQEVA